MEYLVRRAGRKVLLKPRNPLEDPLRHVKQPLSRKTRGKAKIEFDPIDVRHIRAKFSATQKAFARLIGISPETLRSWETGKRRPHGPSRALLRAIDADPFALARVLNWHHDEIGEEPPEWTDDE
jgi:DNA-binding transcriptional regulator YiaG